MSSSPRRWPYVLLAVSGLSGLAFGLLGYLMAGSFSLATTWPPPPGHEAYWHQVAYSYVALCSVSLIVLIVAVIVLWRRRTRKIGIFPGE